MINASKIASSMYQKSEKNGWFHFFAPSPQKKKKKKKKWQNKCEDKTFVRKWVMKIQYILTYYYDWAKLGVNWQCWFHVRTVQIWYCSFPVLSRTFWGKCKIIGRNRYPEYPAFRMYGHQSNQARLQIRTVATSAVSNDSSVDFSSRGS